MTDGAAALLCSLDEIALSRSRWVEFCSNLLCIQMDTPTEPPVAAPRLRLFMYSMLSGMPVSHVSSPSPCLQLPQLSCRGSAVAAAAAAANARLSLRWRCQMTNYLIRGALPSLIPLIADSQGWSQGQVAILFSAFPTGYVLTQIPAGEA